MSIKVMEWAWINGPTDRAELLVLLALADHCNDAGSCYPSMIGIAEKARMTERGAQKCVQRLIAGGFLVVKIGGGRGHKNLYQIRFDATGTGEKGRTTNGEYQTPKAGNPEQTSTKPRTAVHPNRQGTVIKEECVEGDALTEAVSIFNETASRTGWAKVQKLTDARKARLRARLKDAGGIDGWREAMTRAEASDFLTGRANGFRPGLDFFLQESSFVKLMEGNYDNRSGLAGPARGNVALFPAAARGGAPTSLAGIVAQSRLKRSD